MSTATAWNIIEAAESKKFSQNGDCDGLWVTDTTYINLVTLRQDMDYIQAYLIEVCDQDRDATEHFIHGHLEPTETGETWVSYLAVLQRHAGLGNVDFCWYDGDPLVDQFGIPHRHSQPARVRFFDLRHDYATNVGHWFLDWVQCTLEK